MIRLDEHIDLMLYYRKQYQRGLITYEEYILQLQGQITILEAEVDLEVEASDL